MKTTIVAACCVLISLFAFKINDEVKEINNIKVKNNFLETLETVQKAREAVSKGRLESAYILSKRAVKKEPYNRIIYNECWRIYLVCGKYKEAFKISENYFDYLQDLKRDKSQEKDYYFVKYRMRVSEAVILMNENNLEDISFNGIRKELISLQMINNEYCFLELHDAIEMNNLIGVLNILFKGKVKENSSDVTHTHCKQKDFQAAYNYFSLADSINEFFEFGYKDVPVNKEACVVNSRDFFHDPLEVQQKNKIPSFFQTLCIPEYEDEEIQQKSTLKDSIQSSFTKPTLYLECFSDVADELSKFEEFHFVFDHSGSMSDISSETGELAGYTRAEVMKKSASYFILNLVDQEKIFIDAISVGGDCEGQPNFDTYLNHKDYKVPEDKIFDILNWLEEVEPEGMTPLYKMFQILNEHIEPSKKKKAMVIFSDGVNSCDVTDEIKSDNDKLIEIKNEFRKKNMEIFIISLIPEEGFPDAYRVYRELANESKKIYKFTEDCEKIEIGNYQFKLNFFLPEFEECASHSSTNDSLCFDWVDIDECFGVDVEAPPEKE